MISRLASRTLTLNDRREAIMGFFYRSDDPVADAERHYYDDRRSIGRCEYCGEAIYGPYDSDYEDDMPFCPEPNMYLHERCIMDYAKENWKYRG